MRKERYSRSGYTGCSRKLVILPQAVLAIDLSKKDKNAGAGGLSSGNIYYRPIRSCGRMRGYSELAVRFSL
jgi:hypothetical protein